jgi:signal transduction histidine kinase
MTRQWFSLLFLWMALVPYRAPCRSQTTQTASDRTFAVRTIDSLIQAGITLRDQQQGDSALMTWLEVLRQSSQASYVPGINSAMELMHVHLWDLDYSPFYGQLMRQAVAYIPKEKANPLPLAWLLAGYGTTAHKEGRFLTSMRIYREALDALQRDSSTIAQKLKIDLYTKIALVCVQFNEIEQANKWLTGVSNIRHGGYETLVNFRLYQARGLIHYRRKNLDSAYHCFDNAYHLATKLKEQDEIPWIHFISVSTYYCLVLIEENQATKALDILEEQDVLFSKLVQKRQQAGYHHFDLQGILMERNIIKGYAYLKLNQVKKSESVALALLEEARRVGMTSVAGDIYKLLSLVYAAQQDYKQAYEFEKQHFDFRYHLIESAQSRTMAEQYEAEKNQALAVKQLQIQQQEAELRGKDRLLLSISICALLLFAVLIFIWKNYNQKQKLQSSYESNRRQQEEINRLKAKMEGEQQERKRIAHDLHDGIVSQLTALQLNMEALGGKDQKMIHPEQLRAITRQLQEATEELRATTHNLIPDLLLEQGIRLAVAALCEKTARNTQLEVDFNAFGTIPKLQPDAELNVYRIIQELIQNTIKHARASHLTVQLGANNDSLNLTVEDDGVGFPIDRSNFGGIGIHNLRERVTMLHGELDIRSEPGAGTTVYIDFKTKMLT